MIDIEFRWFRTDDQDLSDYANALEHLSHYCHNVDVPINIVERRESLAILDLPHTYPNVVSITTVYLYQENFGVIFPDVTHIDFLCLGCSNINFGKLKEVNVLYIPGHIKERYKTQEIDDDTYKIYNVELDAKDGDKGHTLKINKLIIGN